MKIYKQTFFLFCISIFFPFFNYAFWGKDMHAERLTLLQQKGFSPKVIYDIGAYRGEWTRNIKNIFPKAKFILFEANENNKQFFSSELMPFFVLLGDREENVTFYTNNSTGDSVFIEQTKYYQGDRCSKKELPMTTLAGVVSKNHLPHPDLVKLDVQGAEKLIIQGSPEIIKSAEVVILETKILQYNKDAPLLYEIMSVMNGLGYRMLDILESHYLPTGELNEIDLLFVKSDSKLIKSGLLVE